MKQVDRFEDILGNEKLAVYMKETAVGAAPHALMLIGEDGSGKRTLARLYAQLLLCENKKTVSGQSAAADGEQPAQSRAEGEQPAQSRADGEQPAQSRADGAGASSTRPQAEACHTCQSCLQVAAGEHPDIVTIAPEEGKGKGKKSISVKAVRESVAAAAYMKPYKGPYKIFIIEHAEKMTQEAQNALLKILEEPPAYVVIMLLSTDEESLLETVRSRCVIFHAASVPDEQVAAYLQEYLMVPDYVARPAAAFARGNLGKAAELVGSESFRDECDKIVRYFKKARYLGYNQIAEFSQEIAADPEGCDRYLELIQLFLRDVLTVQLSEERPLFFADEEETVREAAGSLSYRAVGKIENEIYKVKERIEENVAPDMATEVLLAGIKEAYI